MSITNEEWIILGNRICNLHIDLKKVFEVNNIKYKKFYNINKYISFIRCDLDNLICAYYPLPIYNINNINIIEIFYNNSNHNGIIKTKEELLDIINILIIDIINFFNRYKNLIDNNIINEPLHFKYYNKRCINTFNKLRNKYINLIK